MKKFIIIFIIALLVLPVLGYAQEEVLKEQVFKAEVLEILEEKEITREDGSRSIQQNIKLKGLEGKWTNKVVYFYGISDIDVISKNVYEQGQKVMVAYAPDAEGNEMYYIIDSVRTGSLYWLSFIFALIVIFVGRWKGLRALISLVLTFLIILKFIVPKILAGSSPMLITIIGSIFILIIVVYLTEGFGKIAHLSIISIVISLIITGVLSILFTSFAKLTGTYQEEVMFLVGVGKGIINFQGLLLAGIIIGALGVLDDVVISQIAAVKQIKNANPNLKNIEVYKKAMEIGKSHMGSMVNTLFLAYAGASMVLLLLFAVKQEPFLTWTQIVNNEAIATEIVRTLIGSIGLVLAIPISTIIGVNFLKLKNS